MKLYRIIFITSLLLVFGASCDPPATSQSPPQPQRQGAVQESVIAPVAETATVSAPPTTETASETATETEVGEGEQRAASDEPAPTNTTPTPEEEKESAEETQETQSQSATETQTTAETKKTTTEQEQLVAVELHIQSPTGSQEYIVRIAENSTVEAAMDAANTQGFAYTKTKNGSMGAFVKSINQLSEDTASRMYWIFYVNGTRSALGISTKKIHSNDVIEWKYEKEF